MTGIVAVALGCVSTGGGGSSTVTLVAVTGRSIPAGQALALAFNREADQAVTISVQASTDAADPDFRVVRGEVDFEDLPMTPIADLVLVASDRGSGQELDMFTPTAAEPYTLFVVDNNDALNATFSVSITQRR